MTGGKKVKNKITVIGSLNYDVILKVDRLPYKGETMAVEDSTFSAGGKGANQAVQA
jgi:ribokinase